MRRRGTEDRTVTDGPWLARSASRLARRFFETRRETSFEVCFRFQPDDAVSDRGGGRNGMRKNEPGGKASDERRGERRSDAGRRRCRGLLRQPRYVRDSSRREPRSRAWSASHAVPARECRNRRRRRLRADGGEARRHAPSSRSRVSRTVSPISTTRDARGRPSSTSSAAMRHSMTAMRTRRLPRTSRAFARPVSAWVHRTANSMTAAADAARAVEAALQPPGQIATLIVPADAAWGEAGQPAPALPRPPWLPLAAR